MVEVRRLDERDWEVARAARLAALQESPQAFGSTYAREADLDEQRWRTRLRSGAWFVAYDGPRPVGVVCGVTEPDAPTQERHVVSMWVSPADRGRGVGARLVEAVVGWAQADGADTVSLWVADGNSDAASLYRRAGFVATGRRQPLPSDPRRGEELYERRCP